MLHKSLLITAILTFLTAFEVVTGKASGGGGGGGRGGGSSGGGSRGGSSSSRGGSSSSSSSRGGSSYSSSSRSSSSSSRVYSSSSGRYTSYSGSAHVVAFASPIIFRPVYTRYTPIYRPYYYSSVHRTTYIPSSNDEQIPITEQTLYADLPEHCQTSQSYGISLNERYLIFGRSPLDSNTTGITAGITVASCSFTIVGPQYTQLNGTLESEGNCAFWPSDCVIEIWEYDQTNIANRALLFSWTAANAGQCPANFISEYDALAITVRSCDPPDYPNFNFLLTIENGAIRGHMACGNAMAALLSFVAIILQRLC